MTITLTAVYRKVPEGYIGFVRSYRVLIHKVQRSTKRVKT
jgi:hypothetical protein